MPARKTSPVQRLLRIEPGISLGQWAYDRVSGNWDRVAALFLGGGGMTYLAGVTDWVWPWGPVGVGGIGLLSAISLWLGLSLAQQARAKSLVSRAEASAVERWKQVVDTVNPLQQEFHKQRIRLTDLAHPVSKRISGKKFTGCQLVGPANVAIVDRVTLMNSGFNSCDMILVKQEVFMRNGIALEACSIFDCELIECTIFVHPDLFPSFREIPGIHFINLTGDQEIDSRPPGGIGQKTPLRSRPG